MDESVFQLARYILPVIGLIVIGMTTVSLMKNKPRAPQKARLVNIASGDVIPIEYWENSIGRSRTCDIVLNYGTVSRIHGVITLQNNKREIADTRSKTGIYVNGELIKEKTEIFDGDVITLGGVSFAFNVIFNEPDGGSDDDVDDGIEENGYADVYFSPLKTDDDDI